MKNNNKFKITINKKKIDNIKEKNKQNLDKGINILMEYKKFTKEKRKERVNSESTNKKNILRLIIISIIIIITCILIYFFIQFAPILGIKLYNSNKDNINIQNVDYSNSIIQKYNENLIIVEGKNIKTYNEKGKVIWEYNFEHTFKPEIYIKDEYMIICNKQNSTIYLFNNHKQILTKKIDGKINDIYIDSYGNFIIEQNSSIYNKKILLYNKKGVLKEEINMNSDIIIDINILNNAKELVILTANTQALRINSSIKYINLKNKEENIKELYMLSDEIIIEHKIVNNELVILTDKNLIMFSLETNNINKIQSIDNSVIDNIKFNSNYYGLITAENNEYYLKTYNYNLENIITNKIGRLPNNMKISKYIIAVITDTKLTIYNKWGTLLKTIDIKFEPMNIVILNNSKTLALIYGKSIEFINL